MATVAGMAQVGMAQVGMTAEGMSAALTVVISLALTKAAFIMEAVLLIDTAVTAIVVVGAVTGWAPLWVLLC